MPDTEAALARLIDEAAIRDLTARFADAATFCDLDAFRALWTADGIWTIGKPFAARADGPEEIVALLKKLRATREFFVQFAFQGPIVIEGDEARARSIVHEEGRGPGEKGFRCHSVSYDVLRRTGDAWAFVRRAYDYVWLDQAYFDGDAFDVPPTDPLA